MPEPLPLARLMGCPACAHEHMWLDCDFCDCHAHIRPGIDFEDAP